MAGRTLWIMKFGEKIGDFTYSLRTNSIVFYNVIKVVLVALLVVFIAVLLAGNADSDRSADDVAHDVAPELYQDEDESEQGTAPVSYTHLIILQR